MPNLPGRIKDTELGVVRQDPVVAVLSVREERHQQLYLLMAILADTKYIPVQVPVLFFSVIKNVNKRLNLNCLNNNKI